MLMFSFIKKVAIKKVYVVFEKCVFKSRVPDEHTYKVNAKILFDDYKMEILDLRQNSLLYRLI